MVEAERRKLKEAALSHDYMSIAICKEETPVRSVFIPWVRTSSAFNMKIPKLTIPVADLQNPEIIQDLRNCKLVGCYIFTPLEDYSFLTDFHELCDLFIRHGENMRDLSSMKDMPHLFMVYIEDAKLHDIVPLIENCNHGDTLPSKCFGFYHCDIEDTSALKEATFIIGELLIWVEKGKTDHKERWATGRNIGEFEIYAEEK